MVKQIKSLVRDKYVFSCDLKEVTGSEMFCSRVSKVLKSEGFNGKLKEMLQEQINVSEEQRSRNYLGLWMGLLEL